MSVTKICDNCLSQYTVHMSHRQANQKVCPRCQAEKSSKIRSIPSNRTRIFGGNCRIDSLPPTPWVEMPPKTSHDDPYYRLEIRGSFLGRPWDGQITLFAPRPIEIGEIAYTRVMRSIHQIKKIQFGNHTAVLPVATTEADIPALIASGKLAPEAEGHPLVDDFQVRESVVLEPREGEFPVYSALCWVEGGVEEEDKWGATITGGDTVASLVIAPLELEVEDSLEEAR